MKKNIKLIIISIISIIILISIIISNTKRINVETYNIKEDYVSYYFTEEGIVGNDNYYNIYSKNTGDVISVNVKNGDTIKVGDIIGEISGDILNSEITTLKEQIKGYEAQIDNVYLEEMTRTNNINNTIDDLKSQIETLNVQQSSGNISKNEQIKIQQLLIEQSEKNLERVKSDLDKYNILLKEGIVSLADYNQLEEQVTSYENMLQQNKNQLNILEKGEYSGNNEYFISTKKALEVQVNNLKNQLALDYITPTINYYNSQIAICNEQLKLINSKSDELIIKSPVNGVVYDLPMADTNYILSNTPVAIIKEDDNLIESHISTRDIDSISIGSTVNIVIDKRQEKIVSTGVVYNIENEAKVTISPLGLEERKIKVLIKPNEDLNLISGFNVNIEYLLYESYNDIAVPKESVFKYNDGYAVYQITNNEVNITPIKKGIELRDMFVIEDGLNIGDKIILDCNNDEIKEGVKITSLE